MEESVPSAARHTTPRGLSPKRLLEFILPDLNLHCLRLASTSPKVRDTLLKLDEQGVSLLLHTGDINATLIMESIRNESYNLLYLLMANDGSYDPDGSNFLITCKCHIPTWRSTLRHFLNNF